MNNLYLEISPRQTGKTTRLIEAAKEFVNNGIQTSNIGYKYSIFKNKSLIITKNLVITKLLQNKINAYTSSQDSVYDWSNINIYSENQTGCINEFIENNIYSCNIKIFFDEFDWLNHDKIIKLINIYKDHLKISFYASTTPIKLRNYDEVYKDEDSTKKFLEKDLLLYLLNINNNLYTNFSLSKNPFYANSYKTMSHLAFKTNILGQFWDFDYSNVNNEYYIKSTLNDDEIFKLKKLESEINDLKLSIKHHDGVLLDLIKLYFTKIGKHE